MWDIYRGEREVREGKRQKLAKYIKYMNEIVKEQNQSIDTEENQALWFILIISLQIFIMQNECISFHYINKQNVL